MRYQTIIERTGPNTAGIPVPDDVLRALGGGRRPPVTVTVNGYTYRSTVGAMGGRSLIPLSSAHRTASGLVGGETSTVELELDTAPRTVAVPDDLAVALAADPPALVTFERLSNSDKSWHVLQVEAARTAETRARRIAKSVAILSQGAAAEHPARPLRIPSGRSAVDDR